MRPGLRGALLLTVAFVLGTAVGALGVAAFQWRWGGHPFGPEPRASRAIMWHLDRELSLAAAQRERIEAVLNETGLEFERLRADVGPRFHEIRQRSRARIREVLDPAQQEKFDALAERWEARLWRRSGGGPDPPRTRGVTPAPPPSY